MPIVQVLRSEISIAGGMEDVLPFQEEFSNVSRIYSKPTSSNSMKSYANFLPDDGQLLYIYLYADLKRLTMSGLQSAYILRILLMNVASRSE